MTKNKLKVGIIGLGRIASLYEMDARAKRYYPYLTHAGAYTKHPRTELVCGADIDRNRASRFGEMWGVRNLYTDYRQMLRENAIDILSICTPSYEHSKIIKMAAGLVRVIFCEKPFANSAAEIAGIIKLKDAKDTRIAINLYREYDKSHDEVRKIIGSRKYGKVQRVNCYYGKGLRNMGSHLLGWLVKTFGLPKRVRVLGRKMFKDVEEPTYDVYLEFKRGVPAVMQGCDFEKFRLFEIDIIFEKGRMQILDEGLSIRLFKVGRNRAQAGARELIEKTRFKTSVGHALCQAVDHLAAMCDDSKAKPLVSPERYLALQLLIEEIEKQGRRL